jgi:hypothetical protein
MLTKATIVECQAALDRRSSIVEDVEGVGVSVELGALVEHLGTSLQRSVAVDDPGARLLAYSRHHGDVDEARLESVLTRKAPDKAMAYVQSFGISAANEPVRVPANEELGLLPRLCVPIRDRGRLLGYFWIIESGRLLDNSEVDKVVRAAEAAGDILRNDRLAQDLRLAQEQGFMRDLLGADPTLRSHAATELLELQLVAPPRAVCALVLRPAGLDASARSTIDEALGQARLEWPLRASLQLGRLDHGVLVLVSTDQRRDTSELSRRVAVGFRALASGDAEPRIGLGSWVSTLDGAADSYRQALHAARVGAVRRADLTDWGALGVYRTLTKLSPDELTHEALPPSLSALLAADRDLELLITVECFLDLAGDVKRTSERLMLHRTSVYNRLKRIEAVAGIDLTNGLHRLDLHLGLKTARLAGLITEPPVVDG